MYIKINRLNNIIKYLYLYSFCVLNFRLPACSPNFDEVAHWPDLQGNAVYVQRKGLSKINYYLDAIVAAKTSFRVTK